MNREKDVFEFHKLLHDLHELVSEKYSQKIILSFGFDRLTYNIVAEFLIGKRWNKTNQTLIAPTQLVHA